jgi:hypothetical protein
MDAASPDREAFPVLLREPEERKVAKQLESPISVPMIWVRRFERAILANHGKPLAALKLLGGLDPRDIHAAAHGTPMGSVTLAHALLWLAGRPWYPRELEDACAGCGGTFKAQAEGDHPDRALRAAHLDWRNAHSGRCGHGLEIPPVPYAADSWPHTTLRVVSEVRWPEK